ncbi:MAG TPA: hypothetical protein VFG47_16070 [Geminicoccaceae bacterium]|nr:hypothetical protein [Geminicoccaceae bacterium]
MRDLSLSTAPPPALPRLPWRRFRRAAAKLALPAVVAAALAAGAWTGYGFLELSHSLKERRAAATTALLRQYAEPPVADAWARLSGAWRAHQRELEPLLERVRDASGPELEARVLDWNYRVDRIIAEEGLAGDIQTVLRFYQQVAFCVSVGHCDPETTRAFFGRDPWVFRNQHFPYLQAEFPDEDLDRYFEHLAPREGGGG